MSNKIDQWITDHAYAPDDIVLGDGVTSISDNWLTDLHELLDAARPGWRGLFEDPPSIEASEFEEIRGAREDQLRQLLSYCREMLKSSHGGAWDAYEDVAAKLADLLDGEN